MKNFLIFNNENLEIFLKRIKDVNFRNGYIQSASGFDIEVSSFYEGNKKKACCYSWAFGLGVDFIRGRNLNEFVYLLNKMSNVLELNRKKKLVIYVHNLSYEFQFICKWFNFKKVFAIDNRKVVYAETVNGIIFKCSYILTNLPLSKLSDYISNSDIHKMEGDLNYSLIRNCKTPLTEKEVKYIENDVRVICDYIKFERERNHGIENIPLTRTGFVRRNVREKCLKNPEYVKLMKRLKINDLDEYRLLKRAFHGGYTHANFFYTNKKIDNVASFDFCSSYPAVMLAEYYPMGKGVKIRIKNQNQFRYLLKNFCCIFDITIHNLKSKIFYDSFLSASKCWNYVKFDGGNFVINNGRVFEADKICTTLTNVDWETFEKVYTFDANIEISNFTAYDKDLLPKDFLECLLEYYEKKTVLKGVDDKKIEYLTNKGDLNAFFGMCVTDIIRDNFCYEDSWIKRPADPEKELMKYNQNKNRFLFYPWGVFITAYAQRNMWDMILESGDDHIYSDTDSEKLTNYEQHKDFFDKWSLNNYKKIVENCLLNGLDWEKTCAKDIKGNEHYIGIFDFEECYKSFKTLGAKRYMYTDMGDNIHITVAGVKKKTGQDFLKKQKDPYKTFTYDLIFPEEATGKQTLTYIDKEIFGKVTDYLGNETPYYEKSYIHMEGCEYDMSFAAQYKEFIERMRREYEEIL